MRCRAPNGAARVLFGSYDFKLRCLDAEKGTPVWTYESGNYINDASGRGGRPRGLWRLRDAVPARPAS